MSDLYDHGTGQRTWNTSRFKGKADDVRPP